MVQKREIQTPRASAATREMKHDADGADSDLKLDAPLGIEPAAGTNEPFPHSRTWRVLRSNWWMRCSTSSSIM